MNLALCQPAFKPATGQDFNADFFSQSVYKIHYLGFQDAFCLAYLVFYEKEFYIAQTAKIPISVLKSHKFAVLCL